MIGGARGKRASVNAAGDGGKVIRQEDAIERSEGPTGREAVAGWNEVMIDRKVGDAAGGRAPFVQVPHQQGRHRRTGCNGSQHGMRLPAAHQAGEIEMHADDSDGGAVDAEFGQHRAARLECRDLEAGEIGMPGAGACEDRIAVPADGGRADAEGNRGPAMAGEKVWRKGSGPRADTAVCLLQDDDIGADLVENLENALGAAT